uniref:PRA1 family protein n=1 Tax=Fibrocapsa japonica TaxID=94617 RepID=A0A7S2UXU1_9STRA|mmetsp:Transcript_15702/g.23081  ORF Transcript_15702/g.23081 Transcript_15702/m.23081 type:complete len:191 (+) Transcript_15702:138-710(+)|eukprot:CAMPEP_0113941720 /NCGR_PEP_ID=MMETSP1339-20121228/7578_1 /TAXON_ID=94617 /ORGANISM="Fibrocapsa japonica" /LENGTH=190 /DNA_ID=CAMNT_0000945941 /DNA_START=149 /DNA_END=721 /DNA_ORIENTATION=- /assembly_acc=CAM_ASM_000762
MNDDLVSNTIEDVRQGLDQLKQFGLKSMQPWGEFFARFKPPKRWDQTSLEQRINTNYLHYRGNYLFVMVAVTLLHVVLAPVMALVLAVCVCGFILLAPPSGREVRVGQRLLSRNEGLVLASIGSLALLLWSGTLYRLLMVLSLGFAVCVAHMVLRPRTLGSKTNRFMEEAKVGFAQAQQQQQSQVRKRVY